MYMICEGVDFENLKGGLFGGGRFCVLIIADRNMYAWARK